MLYVTTRSRRDTYTAHKSILTDKAPDGGSYVPLQIPSFTDEQILALKDKSFNQTVADILNAFFSSRLTVWDVDFCIGKNPVRLFSMNYRILFAELWHNPRSDFSYTMERLHIKLCGDDSVKKPSLWLHTAVRIAVLFGLYGQLCAQQLLPAGAELDISVYADDFTIPMAAYYARKMGLPINTIVCTCDDNSCIWDLFNRGSMLTSAAPESLLCGLEMLISAVHGEGEVSCFLDCCEKKRSYSVSEEQLPALKDGYFATVTGKSRGDKTINSVYRNTGCVIDPVSALCYAGLQDYRSSTGISQLTLIMADRSPSENISQVAKATGVSVQKLLAQVKL